MEATGASLGFRPNAKFAVVSATTLQQVAIIGSGFAPVDQATKA
jgi:hypothetical protein